MASLAVVSDKPAIAPNLPPIATEGWRLPSLLDLVH